MTLYTTTFGHAQSSLVLTTTDNQCTFSDTFATRAKGPLPLLDGTPPSLTDVNLSLLLGCNSVAAGQWSIAIAD